ncbi:MAG: hypothetical protein ACI8R4_002313 [Paracoccaceae bacterium]|jgi:hypothetical protein
MFAVQLVKHRIPDAATTANDRFALRFQLVDATQAANFSAGA